MNEPLAQLEAMIRRNRATRDFQIPADRARGMSQAFIASKGAGKTITMARILM